MFLLILLEVHPLISPELGLSVWTIIIFLILLVLLRVLAWKPITTAIKNREHHINSSLEQASLAKKEFLELEAKKEEIIKEAELQKLTIIKEAEVIKREAIEKAELEAKKHADAIKSQSLKELNDQRQAIMSSIEHDVSKIAVKIAEKLIQKELSSKENQEELIHKLAKNLDL